MGFKFDSKWEAERYGQLASMQMAGSIKDLERQVKFDIIVNDYKNAVQNYNSEHASILPRMWSSEHAKNYLNYTGFLNFKIKNKYLNEPGINDFISTLESIKAGKGQLATVT